MTTYFDQKNQHVKNQTNVTGNLNVTGGKYLAGDNLEAVQPQEDVLQILEKLPTLITQAVQAGELNRKTAVDVESEIKKATIEAEEDKPQKKNLLTHINDATQLIQGVTTTGQAVTTLIKFLTDASQVVQRVF